MGSDEQKLSSDDIFEILTRTRSLKTLDTCKCVSKNWNKLAYESTFMPLNCKRTNNLSGYFIQAIVRTRKVSVFVDHPDENDERRGNNKKIKKFPIDMRILASCNQGLLCCVREKVRGDQFYVCKPATWQWQVLPKPKLRFNTISVAIMVLGSTPLRYKIVRLSYDQLPVLESSTVWCEIFDSKSWRWRVTKVPDFSRTKIAIPSHPVVCVGSIHWLTNKNSVLVFHEANESFKEFNFSEDLVTGDEKMQLVSYQGTLGLMCQQGSNMELWVVEDYNTYTWTKVKISVNTASLESTFPFIYPTGFYNAGIVFFKTWGEVVFYRVDDGSVRKVGLSLDMAGQCDIFQFRSDLEPVDLRGGRGTRGSICLC